MHQPLLAPLSHIIKNRRTIKATLMNGRIISEEHIRTILSLADFAPTHGRTEPWRFFVYAGEKVQQFCADHAQLYWDNTAETLRTEHKKQALAHIGDNASHIIVVCMKRTLMSKIPRDEEYAATAASIQNILLAAEALHIAAIWNTGGMTLHPSMKEYLKLNKDDEVLALLYLGYTDQEKAEAKRNVPLEEKIIIM